MADQGQQGLGPAAGGVGASYQQMQYAQGFNPQGYAQGYGMQAPAYSQGLSQAHQEQLRAHWQEQLKEVHQVPCDPQEFKNHQLPLARIKKIMKSDEDVRMISAEAPVLFAKACEMFILELTLRSWYHAEDNKRRTLQRNDIAAAITKTDIFDFLIDIVPREDIKVEGQEGGVAAPSGAAPGPAAPAGAPAGVYGYPYQMPPGGGAPGGMPVDPAQMMAYMQMTGQGWPGGPGGGGQGSGAPGQAPDGAGAS